MSEKIKGVLAGLVFLAFGIWMIANPGLMDGAEVSGRRSLFKQIIVWIWSLPAGIILTLLGGFICYGAIVTDETEETNQKE